MGQQHDVIRFIFKDFIQQIHGVLSLGRVLLDSKHQAKIWTYKFRIQTIHAVVALSSTHDLSVLEFLAGHVIKRTKIVIIQSQAFLKIFNTRGRLMPMFLDPCNFEEDLGKVRIGFLKQLTL